MVRGTYSKQRRDELAAFLRSRRERVSPADVGLPPGPRRRTPGLRREEVAQLAGVGVTWYTWLEQGRPINASVQVLDAIARVLKLGPAERWHIYRLAEVPGIPSVPVDACAVPDAVLPVLDALEPNAACVYSGKYDLLACNATYASIFPGLVHAAGFERNALWQIFVGHPGGSPLRNDELLPHMVATVRATYARHVGEADWVDLIDRLSAASDEFAQLWALHEVASPKPQVKAFNCGDVGVIEMRTSGFGVDQMPEARMIVYLPASTADAAKVDILRSRQTRRLRPA